MRQHGITIIVPLRSGHEARLREKLNHIGHHIDSNGLIDFYALRTVHFMRWVMLPGQTIRGQVIPPQLALSTNFDGEEKVHLHELVTVGAKGVQAIYEHCADFPGIDDPDQAVAYLQRHKFSNAAFYGGTVGRAVGQIHDERQLRYAVQNHLQTSNPSQDWRGQSEAELHREIAGAMLAEPDLQSLREPARYTFLYRHGRLVLGLGLLVFLLALVAAFVFATKAALIGLGIFLVWFASWYIRLRIHEKRDRENFKPAPRDAERLAELNQREDYRIQNQITHLVEIKPGWFRQRTIRFVLGAINLAAHLVYNRGNLGGIPSIHFARWAIIDGGKRLLFFSNFDGSWESYLGEFIDRASVGLTGVWSNTEGFPPTKNLVYEGAQNSADFKAWVRAKQLETQVWYSAYKTLTVQNINNNTDIRNGLSGELNQEEKAAWLQKLN
ncbi:MAG: hypothetical protein AAGN35_19625 [Bacteroidota bacterium]